MDYEEAVKYRKGDRVKISVPDNQMDAMGSFFLVSGFDNHEIYEVVEVVSYSLAKPPRVSFFLKSEKGIRGPGSGGPWHPSRVEFSQPMPGQMGYFTRMVLNNKIILSENISKNNINPEQGFKHYGKIKNDFLILFGSVQGPTKRQLIITSSYRQSKPQSKKNYEFLELR